MLFIKNHWQQLIAYALALIVPLVIVLVVFKIFQINISIPLNYSGDALVHLNFAKNIADTGWWITNPKLGAPGIQGLYDFPLSETLSLLILKIIILFGANWYMSVNIFYLLTFPLTALVALYVLQKLNVKLYIALSLAIIYAFIPYHFFRGINHLFLSAYFTIPLSILLAIKENMSKKQLLVFSALLASSGAYYTFFSLIFMYTGFLIRILKNSNFKLLKDLLLITVSIGFVFLLNISPSIIYSYKNGKNLNATIRYPHETEMFGMKVMQLLLPIEDHNINFFSKLHKQYLITGYNPTINENAYSSLGLVASSGFLFLLFTLIFRPKLSSIGGIIDELSSLNIVAVLFATIGGFSLLLSVYLDPVFRSVNRISIFIAFISLAAIGVLLSNLKQLYIAYIIAVLLLTFSLYDQISIGVLRNFSKKTSQFYDLQSYAAEIEHSVDIGAKVYTLPFGEYPEGNDKDMLKVALLTDKISWSSGAQQWRAASYLQYKISGLPAKELLSAIVNAGFTGLLINTKDIPIDQMNALQKELPGSPLVDVSNKYAFYDLSTYENKNAQPLDVLYYISGNCLHDSSDGERFWCRDSAHIVFENLTDQQLIKKVKVTLEYANGSISESMHQIDISTRGNRLDIRSSPDQADVFVKPANLSWPIMLGYPNFIIKNIQVSSL